LPGLDTGLATPKKQRFWLQIEMKALEEHTFADIFEQPFRSETGRYQASEHLLIFQNLPRKLALRLIEQKDG